MASSFCRLSSAIQAVCCGWFCNRLPQVCQEHVLKRFRSTVPTQMYASASKAHCLLLMVLRLGLAGLPGFSQGPVRAGDVPLLPPAGPPQAAHSRCEQASTLRSERETCSGCTVCAPSDVSERMPLPHHRTNSLRTDRVVVPMVVAGYTTR